MYRALTCCVASDLWAPPPLPPMPLSSRGALLQSPHTLRTAPRHSRKTVGQEGSTSLKLGENTCRQFCPTRFYINVSPKINMMDMLQISQCLKQSSAKIRLFRLREIVLGIIESPRKFRGAIRTQPFIQKCTNTCAPSMRSEAQNPTDLCRRNRRRS